MAPNPQREATLFKPCGQSKPSSKKKKNTPWQFYGPLPVHNHTPFSCRWEPPFSSGDNKQYYGHKDCNSAIVNIFRLRKNSRPPGQGKPSQFNIGSENP